MLEVPCKNYTTYAGESFFGENALDSGDFVFWAPLDVIWGASVS